MLAAPIQRSRPKCHCPFSRGCFADLLQCSMLFPVACGIARKEGAGVNDFGAEPAGIPDANASSKSAIRLLTADVAMPSRDAARVRFFCSQTAMNSRSVVRSIRRSSALCAVPPLRGQAARDRCFRATLKRPVVSLAGRYLHQSPEKSQIGARCAVSLEIHSNGSLTQRALFQFNRSGWRARKKRDAEGTAFSCSILDLSVSKNQLAAAAGISRWRFMTILLSAPR